MNTDLIPESNELVLCACCKRDLTYSGGGNDHCLLLRDRMYGPKGMAILDYLMTPLMEELECFCGWHCLKTWIDNNLVINLSPYAKGRWMKKE